MIKRDNIIKNVASEQDKALIVKILDMAEQVQRYYEPRFTHFLDPAQVVKAKRVLEQFKEINYSITSGIQGCERNIISIYPDYMNESDIILPISALSISGCTKFESISHRDILGTLMSLGIKRDKLGDILLKDSVCYCITYSDISYYIILNLTRIKHTSVKVCEIDFKEIPEREQNYKLIPSTVPSLRLDCVCSAGFGESRNSISTEITSGNAKVNWEEVTDLSFKVSEGDTISIKGRGRVILDSVGGLTKKGRIGIIIKKIL